MRYMKSYLINCEACAGQTWHIIQFAAYKNEKSAEISE